MSKSGTKGLYYEEARKRWRGRVNKDGARIQRKFKSKELAEEWLKEQYELISVQKAEEKRATTIKKKEEAERAKEERRAIREANKKPPLTTEERKEKQRAAYAANKERLAKEREEDRKNNPEKYIIRRAKARKAYHSSPSAKEKARISNRRSRKSNPESARARENRRKRAKIQRVPAWAWNSVREKEATLRTEMNVLAQETGLVYNIDHIVPLRAATRLKDGRLLYLASGLHVPDNLQILEESENFSKSCFDWPDKWEYTEEDINELEAIHERVATEPDRCLENA